MKYLLILLIVLLTSCSQADDLKDIADSAVQKIENELPDAAGKAKEALDNMPDLVEKAKTFVYDSKGYDLITQFEDKLKNQTIVQVSTDNNTATIDLSGLTNVISSANSLKSQFTDEFLNATDAEQVKEIERTITIDATGAKRISLARDLAEADVDHIVVKAGNVEVSFTPQMLAEEFLAHDAVNLDIEEGKNSYKISFIDEGGIEIKLLNNVVITITDKRLKGNSVVYDIQQAAKDLIGGRVDDDEIMFQTKTGGDYVTDTNTAKYNDIKDLDKETKEAIEALATRGVFSTEVDEFNPHKTVDRAEAVTMVTKTLYKYDEDFTVNFADVSGTDWFYTAVASGANEKIINGYPDNTFKPANIISKQELLTIAANTLISDRKFLLPEDPNEYLGDFSEEISEWARPFAAMTIRDGIIEQDYAANGSGEITRAEAAVILYNLFEKL